MWSKEEMKFFADLIAAGYVENTKDLDEVVTWTNFANLRVRGVETTFLITSISKGSIPTNRVVLHHYRFAITNQMIINGLGFVSFRVGDTNKYLLYLKKDAKGRYEPLTGQIDPDSSVIRQDLK
jgi:hypothetical protein